MTIIARFHPQAWINDYAVEVDPEGETEFDVTPEILVFDRATALEIKDDDYDSDDLRFATAAPKWVQGWSGPFWIEVADSIVEHYDDKAGS